MLERNGLRNVNLAHVTNEGRLTMRIRRCRSPVDGKRLFIESLEDRTLLSASNGALAPQGSVAMVPPADVSMASAPSTFQVTGVTATDGQALSGSIPFETTGAIVAFSANVSSNGG